jgi:hypothetical protein
MPEGDRTDLCETCGHEKAAHDPPRPGRERVDGSPESGHCSACPCDKKDESACLHDYCPRLCDHEHVDPLDEPRPTMYTGWYLCRDCNRRIELMDTIA